MSLRPIHRTKTANPSGPRAAWLPEWGVCANPNGNRKRAYPNRHAATKDARSLGGTAYRCAKPGCNSYHITHYPPRVNKAIKLLLESLREDVRKGRVTLAQLTELKRQLDASA